MKIGIEGAYWLVYQYIDSILKRNENLQYLPPKKISSYRISVLTKKQRVFAMRFLVVVIIVHSYSYIFCQLHTRHYLTVPYSL